MKISVNYDVMNKILDVKQPFGPLKIARNSKDLWLHIFLPAIIGANIVIMPSVPGTLFLIAGGSLATLTANYSFRKMIGKDFYKDIASQLLNLLSFQLEELHVNTTYDLLLDSEESERKYRIKLNEKKIPTLVEEKYILVPTKTYTNDIKKTSLLQEHVVGSNKWTLSLGSPSKQKKLVPVHTQI